MDFSNEPEFPAGNVAPMAPETLGSSSFDNWGPGLNNQAIWATEDDYRAWNGGINSEIPSNSPYDSRSSQSRSGSEPPSKKTRNSQGGDSQGSGNSRARAIGKMFFKTKLCCKFRAGVCPYITNCNFAHGIEELRRPPPNWQEIVAAHEEERTGVVVEPPREEHQIPTFSSSDMRGESQRSYKGRHCKKFYTEEGCPYGDNCTFLHDEQSRARESVAISLSPSVGSGYGNGANSESQKPSNWKTRICNKWETTGSCPFGSKCHFAHGLQDEVEEQVAQWVKHLRPYPRELHKYGGGLVDVEGKDSSSLTPESKQGAMPIKATETVAASTPSAPHSDIYHLGMGVSSQRPSVLSQRAAQRPPQKWKGPDKISKIYGDWIDDIE